MNGKTYDLPLTTKELSFVQKAVSAYMGNEFFQYASEDGKQLCENLSEKVLSLLHYASSTEEAEKYYKRFKTLTERSNEQ